MRKQELLKHVEHWGIVFVLASLFFLTSCSSGVDAGGGDLPTVVQVVLSDSRSGSATCQVDVNPNIFNPVAFYFANNTISGKSGDIIIAQPCDNLNQLNGLGVNQGGKMNVYDCQPVDGVVECNKKSKLE